MRKGVDMLLEKIKENWVSLGFAEWIDGQGLQIQNTHSIDSEASGVYVMVDENGLIQKVGKSSSSLKNRLSAYKGFDRGLDRSIEKGTRQDESSLRQRRAIKENNFRGFQVYFRASKVTEIEVDGFKTVQAEFDAHNLESTIKSIAESENHPLEFGNK